MVDRVEQIASFINFLRFRRREQVKDIMKATELSRVTLNELEKKQRSVTDNVYGKFEAGYGKVFKDFIKSYKPQTGEERIIEEKEETGVVPDEYKKLATAVSEMAIKYTQAVDLYMEMEKENKRLIEEIKRLRKIIDNLSDELK